MAAARRALHACPPAPGQLGLDSVYLPAATGGAPGGTGVPRLAELGTAPVEVTGDRRFRVLFGPGNGCDAATQFVGEIPPGRAPEHSHPYDEVVLILGGRGVLHPGQAERADSAPGSCVHLPPRAAALPGEHRAGHAAGPRCVPPGRQPRGQDAQREPGPG